MLALAFARLMALAALGDLQFIEQQLNVSGRILWCEGRDVDGDKRADIACIVRRGNEPATQRVADFFLQQADGRYPDKPNAEVAIPAEAVFGQLEDLNGDGRAQLVLVTGHGVSSIAWNGSAMVLSDVLKAQTASPFPEVEDLPEWHFVQDWHGTGAREIALFTVGSAQFFRRNGKGVFEPRETVQIKPMTYVDGQGGAFQGAWSNKSSSITVSHVFPELVVGDYDGDKKPDLFALQDDRLLIFSGDGDKFSAEPKVVLDFNMRTTEERQRRNAFIAATVIDLDGDGRLDYVANKVSGGLSSMHSETHVHLNKSGFRRTPDQMMKRDGFSAMVQFVDLDQDGLPEMIEPFADVGLITLARAMVSKKIGVDWKVTPNHGGAFAVKEERTIPLTFGLDFSGGPMFRGPFPRFRWDFNGDGLPDFMSSANGTELAFNLGQKGTFEAEPSVKVNVEVSPYTAAFQDPRTKRAQVLTFFRDTPGKEGKIIVLLNGTGAP